MLPDILAQSFENFTLAYSKFAGHQGRDSRRPTQQCFSLFRRPSKLCFANLASIDKFPLAPFSFKLLSAHLFFFALNARAKKLPREAGIGGIGRFG